MHPVSIKDCLSIDLPAVHVLDIGAMAEGEDRYAGLVARKLARVTGFEPNPEQLQALVARQGPYHYLPYFLGDGGPATFHVARYPGCSSLYEPDPAVIDLFTAIGAGPGGNFTVIKKVPVQTRRLDDIPELGRVDYIKADVQGAELDVLRHGTNLLAATLVLECEVEFLPLYKGQPLFADVAAFLGAQGFVLHKFIDVGGRCLRPVVMDNNPFIAISQMLWADAVFVRDFTHLDRFTDEELIKSAIVLHEVYFSYDLVICLLREHDRRNDGKLANRYADKVFRVANLPMMFVNLKTHV